MPERSLGELLAVIASEASEHPFVGSERQKAAWDEIKTRFVETRPPEYERPATEPGESPATGRASGEGNDPALGAEPHSQVALDRERELRDRCAQRVAGLGAIVKRLRGTGDPDDLADGAFLLGALDDISAYVDCLRELADV